MNGISLTNNMWSIQNMYVSIGGTPGGVMCKPMDNFNSLATSPTREHIDNIRDQVRHLDAKDPEIQHVILTKDSETGIATICLKSGAKNALSGRMICQLTDVIDELAVWSDGKGVLLYGADGFFCSGSDLVTVKQVANYEDGYRVATLMQYNIARFQALPMISMVLIEGSALGGGAELTLGADLRVMTQSSKIGFVHMRVGVCCGWGGGSRLVQLIGPSRATEILSSARTVGAQEALNIGLINHIISDCDETNHQQVLEKALDYLKQHLIGARPTLLAMKALVNVARALPLDQALAAEAQLFASTWGKEAHRAALSSNIKHR
ncbi:Ethylmalonyl-CoA decarboxylase [Fragariocoptes setiger]|uniref:Ethylmalonyl-CoA decarboxylase n=1 Tax=Fragariocoptes setiger TaxID=1670756 RepID=A0ABQ7SB39_9ACAR|nr:Ethylmalonyl-CoA decarboxylase [Fragariocoptes setiger]